MILQSLVRYYEDLLQQNDKKPMDERIPKLGWCLARVSYMIELKEDGTVKQIISLKTEALKPQILCVPEMFSRSGKCPPAYFLCDNAKYLMGMIRVIKDGGNNPQVNSLDQVKKDFSENITKAIDQIRQIIFGSNEQQKKYFEEEFFGKTHSALTNLNELLADLEIAKLYLNYLKHEKKN